MTTTYSPDSDSFAGWTRDQLYARAREVDLPRRSTLTKEQLRAALRAREQERPVLAWIVCDPHPPITVREGDEVTIGRSAGCTLVLADGSISRIHARLRCSDGELQFMDNGSSNGAYVNGRRVSQASLSPGDVLTLGTYDLEVRDSPRSELEITGGMERRRRGLLSEIDLVEVLQDLEFNERTMRLEVISGGLRGSLSVFGGRLVCARLGNHRGDAAVLGMLDLKEGWFMLTTRVGPVIPSMNSTITMLLLRHTCRRDESRHLLAS